MWQTLLGVLIGTLGSILAAGIIFRISLWYNRKKLSDAKENEYTRLVNEITNLNSKIDNASEATKNEYTRLADELANINTKIDHESEARSNQFNNLNDKFDNGFERFFIEIDKLRTTAETNTKKIDILTSNVETNTQKIDFTTKTINNNLTVTNGLMEIVHELQKMFHNFIKQT